MKYDDLLVETPDMMKGLNRVDKAEKLERERRIKRAFDVSAKKKYVDPANAPENPLDVSNNIFYFFFHF